MSIASFVALKGKCMNHLENYECDFKGIAIFGTGAVAYAENFRGGPTFITIVWRHKSILGEVPKARPL